MFGVLIICCFLVFGSDATVTSCATNGHTYEFGDSWVGPDGCNGCDCTDYGTECRTLRHCDTDKIPHHDLLGQPGAPLCKYSNYYRKVGETWWAVDNCNRCKCTTQGMLCTYKPCKNTGFDKPKQNGGQFMDCRYKNRYGYSYSYYSYKAQFLANDGCNTCICGRPAGYASFPICTTTKCSLIG